MASVMTYLLHLSQSSSHAQASERERDKDHYHTLFLGHCGVSLEGTTASVSSYQRYW